jgi:hypothetical protein
MTLYYSVRFYQVRGSSTEQEEHSWCQGTEASNRTRYSTIQFAQHVSYCQGTLNTYSRRRRLAVQFHAEVLSQVVTDLSPVLLPFTGSLL